ncbi:MAG: Aspartate-semialdehyde dehydrogenase, partial [uncultured Acidimicrobiales bacterium]
ERRDRRRHRTGRGHHAHVARRAGLPRLRAAPLRLRPLGRQNSPVAGRGDHGGGRGDRRLLRPRSGPLRRRRHPVEGAGPQGRRRRGDSGRQLLGLASRRRRAPGGGRGEPRGPRLDTEGHRRQPELHDDGGHAGAQAAARRGRAAAHRRQHLPVGLRRGSARGRRAGEAGDRRRPPLRRAGLRRRRRRVPDARGLRRTDRLQRHPPGREAGRRGDGRGAQVPPREPEDPRPSRAGRLLYLRPGAGVHRALRGPQRRVRKAAVARTGHRAAGLGTGRGGHRRAHPAGRRRQGPLLRRAHPARSRGRLRARPLRLRRQPAQGRRAQRRAGGRGPRGPRPVRCGGERPGHPV